MRERHERERLSTAETMRQLTGGEATPRKPCGCPDDGTICLHGIPAGLPDGDAPPAVQRPDYLGIARDHPLAVDAYLNHQSREFQLPASLLAPINTDPPPHEEQPPPIVNHHPVVQDLVRRDIDARKQVGIERYGTPLQPFNGRDPLRDLYEELLDAVMYIRQVMYERDRK